MYVRANLISSSRVLILLGFRTECENETLWFSISTFVLFVALRPSALPRHLQEIDGLCETLWRVLPFLHGWRVKVIVGYRNRSQTGSHETQVRIELIPL